MPELKPCPFCGGHVDYSYNIEFEPDGIRCMNCRYVMRYMKIKAKTKNEPVGDVMEKMAIAWNRRWS